MCGTIAVAIIAVIARKSYKKRISRYHDRNNKKKLDKIKKVLADEECSGDRSWWHRP